jgi:Fur family ferric uptake transcriptional regulator
LFCNKVAKNSSDEPINVLYLLQKNLREGSKVQNLIEQKLRDHHLRPTQPRCAILSVFHHNAHALSHADLERELEGACDRVTIYRTLEVFENKGLIHKVVDDSPVTKYALCPPEACSTHRHNDQHLHFQCRKCGYTFCLPLVKIPEVNLPEGYQLDTLSMVAEGLCKPCATQ